MPGHINQSRWIALLKVKEAAHDLSCGTLLTCHMLRKADLQAAPLYHEPVMPTVLLSNIQLARVIRAFLVEPGGSVEEKASLIGLSRRTLLRASQGTISTRARTRLLAYFRTPYYCGLDRDRVAALRTRPGPRPQAAGRPIA